MIFMNLFHRLIMLKYSMYGIKWDVWIFPNSFLGDLDIYHHLLKKWTEIKNCDFCKFLKFFIKLLKLKFFLKILIFSEFYQNFKSVYMVDICHVWYQMRCLDIKRPIFERIWYVWTFAVKFRKNWKILILADFSKFFKSRKKMPFLAIFIKIFNRSIWSIYVMYGIKTCLWDPKSQFLGSFDTYHYLAKIWPSMKNCHFLAIF